MGPDFGISRSRHTVSVDGWLSSSFLLLHTMLLRTKSSKYYTMVAFKGQNGPKRPKNWNKWHFLQFLPEIQGAILLTVHCRSRIKYVMLFENLDLIFEKQNSQNGPKRPTNWNKWHFIQFLLKIDGSILLTVHCRPRVNYVMLFEKLALIFM